MTASPLAEIFVAVFDLFRSSLVAGAAADAKAKKKKGREKQEDVYAEYYQQERGEPAPPELLAAFREVEDEVSHAAP